MHISQIKNIYIFVKKILPPVLLFGMRTRNGYYTLYIYYTKRYTIGKRKFI